MVRSIAPQFRVYASPDLRTLEQTVHVPQGLSRLRPDEGSGHLEPLYGEGCRVSGSDHLDEESVAVLGGEVVAAVTGFVVPRVGEDVELDDVVGGGGVGFAAVHAGVGDGFTAGIYVH